MCRNDSLHGTDADLEFLRDPFDALSFLVCHHDGFLDCRGDPQPAQRLALSSRPRQTRVYPLLDHGVLEFGEYPAHLEHGYF